MRWIAIAFLGLAAACSGSSSGNDTDAGDTSGTDTGTGTGADTDTDSAAPYQCETTQGWSWRTGASMAVARSVAGAAEAQGYVYVMGGQTDTSPGITAAVERYDPVSDQWTSVASMPQPGCCFAVALVGDRIYVAGGYNGDFSDVIADVFSYDPTTDAWRTEPAMPTARANAGGAAWNGFFAVVGGRTTYNGSSTSGAIELFDPQTATWSRFSSDLPTPREAAAGATVGNGLYVIGGAASDVNNSYGMATVERYRHDVGQWTSAPDLLLPRVGLSGGLVQDCLVVAGGWTPMAHTATAELFKSQPEAWAALPDMPTARANPAAAVVNGELVVAGGWQYAGGGVQTKLSTVEILSLP
ncbi:MAG: kelch repeat-containing protein [Deltaproteobacteria bacterium]|nr:kelch repeat-containing protein [Deltaproteobacteria bacterium]